MKIALNTPKILVFNNFQYLEVNQTFCLCKTILSHLASSVLKPLKPKPHRYNNFDFNEPMLPNCDVH